MARLDWKRGRFNADYETNEIQKALAGWQANTVGTTVDYYRFLKAQSVMDDVYDEGTGVGRVYEGPFPLPALHATHLEGGRQNRSEGLFTNDALYVTASYDQIRRLGLTKLDIQTEAYLTDRMVYDNKVYTVTNMQILGQIQDRDLIVGINGTQVTAGELVNDAQFRKWSL